MVRAMPREANWASLLACTLLSLALVATTARVVFGAAARTLARAGDNLPCGRVAHVAQRVDGDQGGDQHAPRKGDGERSDTSLHGPCHAEEFADSGARAGAHAAFLHRVRGGCRRRRLAHGG